MTSYIDRIFRLMIIWDQGSSTIFNSLGMITWRHPLEISHDQQKSIKNPGDYGGALFVDTNFTVIFTQIIFPIFCLRLWLIEQRQLNSRSENEKEVFKHKKSDKERKHRLCCIVHTKLTLHDIPKRLFWISKKLSGFCVHKWRFTIFSVRVVCPQFKDRG